MPAPLADMLAAHLARRGLTAADAGTHLFVSLEGQMLRYNNWLRRHWTPAVIAAELPNLQFHDLRRTAATAMVAAGVDVRTAQARLGHADPRVTLGLYAQATASGDREAAEVLGRLLMAPSSSLSAEAFPSGKSVSENRRDSGGSR